MRLIPSYKFKREEEIFLLLEDGLGLLLENNNNISIEK